MGGPVAARPYDRTKVPGMSHEGVREPMEGDGYAVGSLNGLGEGYGFRRIRRGLGVEAFGVPPPEGSNLDGARA